MDYEKKYKEALEKAKEVYNRKDATDGGKLILESMFPEFKESEDEKSKHWILEYLYDGLRKSDEQFKDQFKAAIAWLEKQGNQKSGDKVESKFKVGDFILNGDVTNKGKHEIFKILKVCSSWYDVENIYDGRQTMITFAQEYTCKLWTIQDAKDGDVLTCYSDIKGQPIEQTGIIKQYVGRHGGCSNSFKAHFGVDWDNNVVIEGYMGSSNIYPSTKEQRGLLLQKMKEAGYEWDDEKKELKKIEQKFTGWSEEDYKRIDYICDFIWKNRKGDIDEVWQQEQYVKWLESLKQRLGGISYE